jgi:poly-gamma-glutamate capsule biosynthesis protein CapA/YwtB (metallophosphatase superfamily)
MARPLTLSAAGDALVSQRIASRDPAALRLVEIIRSADVRFVNLEGTLHDFAGSPQATSGGTYVCGSPAIIDDLAALGFNLYAAANNHMLDWGEGGLLGTMATLDRAGVVYAGIGRHLAEARMPRYLETSAGRVALIAVTSTIPPGAYAGEQRPDCQGRPGVNPLRFDTTVMVDRATLDALREIDRRLKLSVQREHSIRLGFQRPDPEGIATLLGQRFRVGEPQGVRTQPHAADLAGNLSWIRDARRQAGWVVVSVHAHEQQNGDNEQPAEFVPAFCRAAVEAGADLVLGHGPHILRGMEVYRGRPIFYSIGNFIFQNETLLRQPQDFYDRLGLPITATPADLFDARGARGGFAADPAYWESVVPVVRFDAEPTPRLAEIRLYPVTLGYGLPRAQRGNPVLAGPDPGRAIIERVARLSPGCTIRWDNDGFGVVTV